MKQQLSEWLLKTGDRVDRIQPKPLHLILPGCGGTYRFDQTNAKHIGFTGCHGSVGVFFIVDDERYFAANIDVRVRPEGSNGLVTGSTRVPVGTSSSAFIDVTNGTFDRLQKESTASGWLKLVGSSSARMRDSLVLTGSWMSSPVLDELVPERVAKAVMAFLSVTRETRSMREGHGTVVVSLPNGEVVEQGDHWLEPEDWKVAREDGRERKWQFGVSA